MRIRRRPNGYYYAIPEVGIPYSLRTKDRDTALRAAADEDRKPKGDTVAAIVAAYLLDKADKPSAQTNFAGSWKALEPHFGHLRPEHITRPVSKAYWLRRAGRSNGTIIKELNFLKAALRWQDKNTPAIIVTPHAPQPRDRFITKSEYRKLFYKAGTAYLKVWLALAWYTAGRKEALLSLTWDRVSLEAGGRINLGPDVGKKGRQQALPIHKALRRILKIAKRGALSNAVVERGAERILNIKKGFAAAVKRAGLEHLTPHDIRRSAARQMIERGISMEVVSQVLGHKSIAVTARVYARFSPGYLSSAINAL